MTVLDRLALQRLVRRYGIHPWTDDQTDLPRIVPNRADRRRNRRNRGVAS
ncbi:hypothetical protein ACIBCR_14875 [Micromonospora echinospora]